eukprot:2241611-Prymnesium_polylepis.1
MLYGELAPATHTAQQFPPTRSRPSSRGAWSATTLRRTQQPLPRPSRPDRSGQGEPEDASGAGAAERAREGDDVLCEEPEHGWHPRRAARRFRLHHSLAVQVQGARRRRDLGVS